MNKKQSTDASWRLLYILLILLPLMLLFFLPGGSMVHAMWFWLVLLLCFWFIWMFLGLPASEDQPAMEAAPRMIPESEQPAAIRALMDVRIATEEEGIQIFRGRLQDDPESVFEKLKDANPDRTVPLLQEDEKMGSAIFLLPKTVEKATMEKPVHPWLWPRPEQVRSPRAGWAPATAQCLYYAAQRLQHAGSGPAHPGYNDRDHHASLTLEATHRHTKMRVVHCPGAPIRVGLGDRVMELKEGEEIEMNLAPPSSKPRAK